MNRPVRLVLSCEHAGNEVPDPYAPYFASTEAKQALASHRGWDRGSLAIGEAMSDVLDTPMTVQSVTRLLVECNRSLHHPRLFSEFSRGMTEAERRQALERYWHAHRDRVKARMGRAGTIVHVGVHTFTPVWKGKERNTDVGLLFDPARPSEARFVRAWREELRAAGLPAPGAGVDGDHPFRIHLNRPYRGWTDGLTAALRKEFDDARYVGVELEVSQRWAVARGSEIGRWLGRALAPVLSAARG